ncbi:molybdate/tungstate transport system ATP-binding protein [Balnearium lithotrophicum]|uniref:Molybdate/tungstate transport system ATP-binding protein n=1 Tax=Balnearium lithotrophicum TaxID=223788 RepID=A0A521BGG0_9BACT|nr:ATP-binding cassette domain-containing protein [Balnearium lithotrophicum]SMO46129.1 molybdate/tungstate transport system ATP-binding protein [Balnearium lithotrophicum]
MFLEVNFKKKLSKFELSVSFEVEEKEYFFIFGRSGAGKSMTVKIITGIEKPDKGRIYLNGKDITNLPIEERRIAYISQTPSLFPHMNVLENLCFPFKVRGLKPKLREIEEISQHFGISEILQEIPSKISGGEAQRVAIVRALLSKPHLLILDEPLNQLDFFTKTSLIPFLKDLKEKTTVIHITHDPFEIKELSDRVIFLERGKVKFVGSFQNLLSEFNFSFPSL